MVEPSVPLTAAEIQELQEIVGVFLFYSRAVDPTMLTAINKIASRQAKPTSLSTCIEQRENKYTRHTKTWSTCGCTDDRQAKKLASRNAQPALNRGKTSGLDTRKRGSACGRADDRQTKKFASENQAHLTHGNMFNVMDARTIGKVRNLRRKMLELGVQPISSEKQHVVDDDYGQRLPRYDRY